MHAIDGWFSARVVDHYSEHREEEPERLHATDLTAPAPGAS
jgi:hypothetical protein